MKLRSISRLFCALMMAAGLSAPAMADSFVSSASSAGSASSASISDSISNSSHSSSKDKHVAAGDYQVIDIAQAPAKADTTRLTLRAVAQAQAHEFYLDVPNRALAARPLQAGAVVAVKEHEYGYEFAHADTQRAFFLALQDDWYRDLKSQRVTL